MTNRQAYDKVHRPLQEPEELLDPVFTPEPIDSFEEYTEVMSQYRAMGQQLMEARNLSEHAKAARIAREMLPLEEALTLYDATNGRR